MAYTMKSQRISPAGREGLAAAVSLDHDWDLPSSGHDKLMSALSGLSTEDLESAALLAYHLNEAVTCLLIRRDMEADSKKRGAPEGTPRCRT